MPKNASKNSRDDYTDMIIDALDKDKDFRASIIMLFPVKDIVNDKPDGQEHNDNYDGAEIGIDIYQLKEAQLDLLKFFTDKKFLDAKMVDKKIKIKNKFEVKKPLSK